MFSILKLEPTVYIKGTPETPVQLVKLYYECDTDLSAVVSAGAMQRREETDCSFDKGKGELLIGIPSYEHECELLVTVTDKISGNTVAERSVVWAPQRRFNVHFVPTTHHDLGYTHPIEPLFECYRSYYRDILRFMRETDDYPDDAKYRYTVEEYWSLADFLKNATQEEREELVRRVREGRMEISALYANVIDVLCSDEEIFRAIYPSNDFCRENRLERPKTACLTDIPGMSEGTIKALTASGVKYLFAGFPRYFEWADVSGKAPDMKHSFWDESKVFPKGRPQLFKYRCDSGDEIISWYQAGYGWFGDYENHCIETDSYEIVEKYLPGFLSQLEKSGFPYSVMRYIDHGSDNQPPQKVISDIARQWNETYLYPHIIVSTNTTFFESITDEAGELPVVCGELPHTDYPTLTLSQAHHTALNAKNRYSVSVAQKLCATLEMAGQGVPSVSEFNDIYSDILLFDEHCYGMGLPAGAAHEFTFSNKSHYAVRGAFSSAAVTAGGINALVGSIKVNKENGLCAVVYNPNTKPFSGVVTVYDAALADYEGLRLCDGEGNVYTAQEDIADSYFLPYSDAAERYAFSSMGGVMNGFSKRFICHVKDIPPMGYKVFKVEKISSENKNSASNNSIENNFWQISFDNGHLSVTDKTTKNKLFDHDSCFAGEILSYNIKHDELRRMTVDDVRVRLDGECAKSLIFTGGVSGSPRTAIEVVIYNDTPRIDFFVRLLLDGSPFDELFIAFPFATKAKEFTYRGVLGERKAFSDAIPGVNTHQYAATKWCRVNGEEGGFTVSSADSHMYQFGNIRPTAVSHAHHGINPVGYLEAFETESGDKGYVYSMLTYNNSRTNFSASQNGTVCYSFSIGCDDDSEGFADTVCTPALAVCFEAEKLEGAVLPEVFSALSLNGDKTEVFVLKKAQDANGYIIGLRSDTAEDTDFTLELNKQLVNVKKAFITNGVEENLNEIDCKDNTVCGVIKGKSTLFIRIIV